MHRTAIGPGYINIKTEIAFKGLLERSLAQFEKEKERLGIWARLIIFIENRSETYDIDDPSEVFVEDDNPFKELSRQIDQHALKAFIYLHCYNEDDDSVIYCGCSSIYLDFYIGGYKKKGSTRIEYENPDHDNGLRGEPYELSNWIDYYKGEQYSQELVDNFYSYIDPNAESDNYFAHFPIPITFENWGECLLLPYKKDAIKLILGIDVANDYLFAILKSGEIQIMTPIDENRDPNYDEDYSQCCLAVAYEDYENITCTAMPYKRKNMAFACSGDASIIATLKFCHRTHQSKERRRQMASAIAGFNLRSDISLLEECCAKIRAKVERF